MADIELDEIDGARNTAVVGGDVADFNEDNGNERDDEEEGGDEGVQEACPCCDFDTGFGGESVGAGWVGSALGG